MGEQHNFIHETAVISNCDYNGIKAFRNARLVDSTFGEGCSVGDDTTIERCFLEKFNTINRRSYLNDSSIGMFTYAGINTTINWSKIGRFCSIGRNVDIGGFDHDVRKLTTMPQFRFSQLEGGGGKLNDNLTKETEYCMIGNDVWIAAGVNILHDVKIGDGAVIGAGAVVTHDVSPYTIVAGVPAKVIGMRCPEKLAEELCSIKWWDWPIEIIQKHMKWIIENDISTDTITILRDINESVKQ